MTQDDLTHVLNRNLDFIKQADTKAAYLSTILFFTLGYLISKFSLFSDQAWSLIVWFLLLFIAGAVFSFIARSINPTLSDVTTKSSLIYFGSISSLSQPTYKREIKKLSARQHKEQLEDQVYVTAKIASTKMFFVSSCFKYLPLFILVSALATLSARIF